MEQAFERQVLFLSETTDSASFFNHWPESPVETLSTISEVKGDGILINQDTARCLMLKERQVQALLLPGAEIKVLAEWYPHNIARSSQHALPDAICLKYESLYKLFGDVKQPRVGRSVTPLPRVVPNSATVPGPVFAPASVPAAVTAPTETTSPQHNRPQSRPILQTPTGPGIGSSVPPKAHRYAGKSYNPAKRPGSPQSGGITKGLDGISTNNSKLMCIFNSALGGDGMPDSLQKIAARLKEREAATLDAWRKQSIDLHGLPRAFDRHRVIPGELARTGEQHGHIAQVLAN
ncbi:hypothetical protein F5883DRAFT_644233 [Diaporthe sp. PMI_573]|nr:hypothetical protein F5883DRAFT_644233 [Diaporthaceae sp. PMI_573]